MYHYLRDEEGDEWQLIQTMPPVISYSEHSISIPRVISENASVVMSTMNSSVQSIGQMRGFKNLSFPGYNGSTLVSWVGSNRDLFDTSKYCNFSSTVKLGCALENLMQGFYNPYMGDKNWMYGGNCLSKESANEPLASFYAGASPFLRGSFFFINTPSVNKNISAPNGDQENATRRAVWAMECSFSNWVDNTERILATKVFVFDISEDGGEPPAKIIRKANVGTIANVVFIRNDMTVDEKIVFGLSQISTLGMPLININMNTYDGFQDKTRSGTYEDTCLPYSCLNKYGDITFPDEAQQTKYVYKVLDENSNEYEVPMNTNCNSFPIVLFVNLDEWAVKCSNPIFPDIEEVRDNYGDEYDWNAIVVPYLDRTLAVSNLTDGWWVNLSYRGYMNAVEVARKKWYVDIADVEEAEMVRLITADNRTRIHPQLAGQGLKWDEDYDKWIACAVLTLSHRGTARRWHNDVEADFYEMGTLKGDYAALNATALGAFGTRPGSWDLIDDNTTFSCSATIPKYDSRLLIAKCLGLVVPNSGALKFLIPQKNLFWSYNDMSYTMACMSDMAFQVVYGGPWQYQFNVNYSSNLESCYGFLDLHTHISTGEYALKRLTFLAAEPQYVAIELQTVLPWTHGRLNSWSTVNNIHCSVLRDIVNTFAKTMDNPLDMRPIRYRMQGPGDQEPDVAWGFEFTDDPISFKERDISYMYQLSGTPFWTIRIAHEVGDVISREKLVYGMANWFFAAEQDLLNYRGSRAKLDELYNYLQITWYWNQGVADSTQFTPSIPIAGRPYLIMSFTEEANFTDDVNSIVVLDPIISSLDENTTTFDTIVYSKLKPGFGVNTFSSAKGGRRLDFRLKQKN